MMKNKITKIIVNGGVLAAIAALGITAYQLGTTPVKEEMVPEETPVQITGQEETRTDEDPMVDAGTNHVKASIEDEDSDFLSDDEETAGPVITDEEATDEEAASQETTAEISAEKAPDFSEDTLMEWPVNGNIAIDYSMDQTVYFPTLDQYKLSPAIAVSAVEDAPVVAAADGVVYSISQDAITGTTMTMELGNGYQAVYGQLKDLAAEEGDTIQKGTIIGYISAPTKYYSREGSNLYFEMKKDGTPIDPIAYLP